jgi:hypothetical protein
MDFIEIGEVKYDSQELTNIAANNLFELGINGINAIDIHAPSNCITIGFDDTEDSELVHAIAKANPSPNAMQFKSQNAVKFLLELNSVVNSWGHDQ